MVEGAPPRGPRRIRGRGRILEAFNIILDDFLALLLIFEINFSYSNSF
jgi:hypothetical protein